jgi:hypothetical protein
MASAITFTDRSRYETGTGRCAMQRYLRYHAGPSGYGWASKSESVPLATGHATHEGLSELTKILRDHDRLPYEEEVRAVIAKTRTLYEATLTKRGYRGGMYTGPVIEETIKEQSALIHGLIWSIALRFLPWLHTTYRVLEVEQERLHFLHCTCGAGPLPQVDHDARGCQGRALMIRTDLLCQHRIGNHLAYFEGKTTGWDSELWAEQWETKPQLGLGTLDLEKKYQQEVSEIYIVAMSKGSRKKDKPTGMLEDHPLWGMKRQQSALCYGYCRPGNPPLAKDDWLPAYEWINEAGEVKHVSRAHKKRGVWELDKSDWGLWTAYKSSEPDMVPEEFWARQLPTSVLDKVVFVLGPLNRQDAQLASLVRSMNTEESRWQSVLWTLYELQQQPGFSWETNDFQQKLDEVIARSWNCRPYGREHQCEFVPLCFRHAGWQSPASIGFIPRRPHHLPETEQAVARGLLIDEAEEIEEEG